jgi:hypothetical protein
MAGLFVIAGSAFGQPAITSITPSSGPTKGGNILRLQGTGLAPGAVAVVGTRAATVLSALGSEMYVLCPAGDGSSLQVVVIAGGMTSNAVSYSYDAPIVGSVTPAAGATSGGTIITIRGENFGVSPSVTVGGSPSVPTSSSHSQIVCPLPPGVGANRPVLVSAGGQSSSPGRFDYSPPSIVGITPQSVPTSGALITITGQNFGASSPQVFIDGKSATVQNSSHVQIVASAPPGEGAAAEVEVVAGGQSSPPALLSYLPPVISGIITPPGGVPTAGGVLITIQGSNFGLAPEVTVDDLPAPNLGGSSHSTIVCAAPEGRGSSARVRVQVRDQYTNSHAISYAPPVITNVIGGPTGNTIPSSGGTIITIFGSNFGATSNKLFVGGLSMNNVQHDPLSPHTKLIATAPPGFGRGHPVMTLVGDQVGYFSSLLHYDMPVCAGDADGDGIVDFDDITSSLANWSSSCP